MTQPTPADLFAIVPVSPGQGSAPDNAIVVGPMSEVFEYIPQSIARQDAVEELEKARFTADQIASMQSKTRAVQATMLADSVTHLASRLDSFLQRRADEEREEARAREEAEAQRIQDELNALPDPDDPTTFEDDPAEGHTPGGELHSLAAKAEHDPRRPHRGRRHGRCAHVLQVRASELRPRRTKGSGRIRTPRRPLRPFWLCRATANGYPTQ